MSNISPNSEHPGELGKQDAVPGRLITLFAIPKRFDGHIGLIQRNAINSWQKLGPTVRVILMGNESGTAEIASELDLEHVPDLQVNELGTPLLSDAFAKADELADTPFIAYVNSDIILLSDFVVVMDRFLQSQLEQFLMIGRRIDTAIDEAIDFDDPMWDINLREMVAAQGELAPVVCKDYFVFPKGQFAEIPAFAVGRGNWDNWMVANANQKGMPVVDATNVITAVHQNHDYGHVKGGRRAAYVIGREARANHKLAGGSNLVSGCNSTVQIHDDGENQKLIPVESIPFWHDLPRFLGLVKSLIVQR